MLVEDEVVAAPTGRLDVVVVVLEATELPLVVQSNQIELESL